MKRLVSNECALGIRMSDEVCRDVIGLGSEFQLRPEDGDLVVVMLGPGMSILDNAHLIVISKEEQNTSQWTQLDKDKNFVNRMVHQVENVFEEKKESHPFNAALLFSMVAYCEFFIFEPLQVKFAFHSFTPNIQERCEYYQQFIVDQNGECVMHEPFPHSDHTLWLLTDAMQLQGLETRAFYIDETGTKSEPGRGHFSTPVYVDGLAKYTEISEESANARLANSKCIGATDQMRVLQRVFKQFEEEIDAQREIVRLLESAEKFVDEVFDDMFMDDEEGVSDLFE